MIRTRQLCGLRRAWVWNIGSCTRVHPFLAHPFASTCSSPNTSSYWSNNFLRSSPTRHINIACLQLHPSLPELHFLICQLHAWLQLIAAHVQSGTGPCLTAAARDVSARRAGGGGNHLSLCRVHRGRWRPAGGTSAVTRTQRGWAGQEGVDDEHGEGVD